MCLAPMSCMTFHTSFITFILLIGLATVSTAEPKTVDTKSSRAPLTLKLSTTLAPAPAQVTARISVEPDARSRSLTVEWWSREGAGGSHALTLDGDRAAMRQDFAIKRIEAGEYVVRVILTRDDGSIVKKESNLIVVGEGSRFITDGGTELLLAPFSPGGR